MLWAASNSAKEAFDPPPTVVRLGVWPGHVPETLVQNKWVVHRTQLRGRRVFFFATGRAKSVSCGTLVGGLVSGAVFLPDGTAGPVPTSPPPNQPVPLVLICLLPGPNFCSETLDSAPEALRDFCRASVEASLNDQMTK